FRLHPRRIALRPPLFPLRPSTTLSTALSAPKPLLPDDYFPRDFEKGSDKIRTFGADKPG
ncbi:MAG TPA: hypothetical protein VMW62_15760, partial [Chloroflexota bacterium]|nr:hypothetical protein [Chloroflexota bacterium]